MLRQRDLIEDPDEDRQPIHDLQGSPLNLVNSDTGVVLTDTGYTYDAWGQGFEPGSGSQPDEINKIRYHTGYVEDFRDETDWKDGTYRMGARHYSTVLGRFLQREPLNLPGPPSPYYPLAINDYLYSHNSPSTKSDPSGLAPGMMDMGSGSIDPVIYYPPEDEWGNPVDPDGPTIPWEDWPGPIPMLMPPPPGMPSFPWWDRRGPFPPIDPWWGFGGDPDNPIIPWVCPSAVLPATSIVGRAHQAREKIPL